VRFVLALAVALRLAVPAFAAGEAPEQTVTAIEPQGERRVEPVPPPPEQEVAALDPQSEELVRRVLGELRAGGKTVIVITHRVRAAAAADSVALLGQGRVLAHGPHANLLRDNPAYAALWQEHALPNAIAAA